MMLWDFTSSLKDKEWVLDQVCVSHPLDQNCVVHLLDRDLGSQLPSLGYFVLNPGGKGIESEEICVDLFSKSQEENFPIMNASMTAVEPSLP